MRKTEPEAQRSLRRGDTGAAPTGTPKGSTLQLEPEETQPHPIGPSRNGGQDTDLRLYAQGAVQGLRSLAALGGRGGRRGVSMTVEGLWRQLAFLFLQAR